MKIKNMKNGFSLIELAVIVVIVGVMFGAGASVLKGRSSTIEINKSIDRLNQAYSLIQGYAALNKNLPNISDTSSADNLTDFFDLKDGYGNSFRYIVANNLLHSNRNTICKISTTPLKIEIRDSGALVKEIQNVAFIIASNGSDLKSQLTANNNNNNNIIKIDRTNPKAFDDMYKYDTLINLQIKAKCGEKISANNDVQILTDKLPIYQEIQYENRASTGGTPYTIGKFRPVLGASPAIITNRNSARWCVEIDRDINLANARNSINILPMDANFVSTDSSNPTDGPVPIRGIGECTNVNNYEKPAFYTGPYYGINIVLNNKPFNIVPNKTYILKVYATGVTPTYADVDFRIYKFTIPNTTPVLVQTP